MGKVGNSILLRGGVPSHSSKRSLGFLEVLSKHGATGGNQKGNDEYILPHCNLAFPQKLKVWKSGTRLQTCQGQGAHGNQTGGVQAPALTAGAGLGLPVPPGSPRLALRLASPVGDGNIPLAELTKLQRKDPLMIPPIKLSSQSILD